MSLRQRLYERYFIASEEVSADEEQQRELKVNAVSEWITRPFHADFVAFLKSTRSGHDPRPGPHENMLYTAGVRDGIGIVLDHLDALEREVREHRASREN